MQINKIFLTPWSYILWTEECKWSYIQWVFGYSVVPIGQLVMHWQVSFALMQYYETLRSRQLLLFRTIKAKLELIVLLHKWKILIWCLEIFYWDAFAALWQTKPNTEIQETISAAEGQHLGKMVFDTLEEMRKDDLFREKIADLLSPLMWNSHSCHVSTSFQDNVMTYVKLRCYEFSKIILYHQLYYEAIDSTNSCLQNRFRQPGYKVYRGYAYSILFLILSWLNLHHNFN